MGECGLRTWPELLQEWHLALYRGGDLVCRNLLQICFGNWLVSEGRLAPALNKKRQKCLPACFLAVSLQCPLLTEAKIVLADKGEKSVGRSVPVSRSRTKDNQLLGQLMTCTEFKSVSPRLQQEKLRLTTCYKGYCPDFLLALYAVPRICGHLIEPPCPLCFFSYLLLRNKRPQQNELFFHIISLVLKLGPGCWMLFIKYLLNVHFHGCKVHPSPSEISHRINYCFL